MGGWIDGRSVGVGRGLLRGELWGGGGECRCLWGTGYGVLYEFRVGVEVVMVVERLVLRGVVVLALVLVVVEAESQGFPEEEWAADSTPCGPS